MLLTCQVSIATGIAIGFFFCYATVTIQNSASWRLPFAFSTAISLVVAVGCHSKLIVYSPRWLMKQGRREAAERVLDLIAGTENVEERREMLQTGADAKRGSFLDIFSKGVRGRTCLGAFLFVDPFIFPFSPRFSALPVRAWLDERSL